MNIRDRKHILVAFFFFLVMRKWGVWWCDSVFVPPQPSGSEGQTGNEHEERERLRRVLKQMGRIKCPSEVCTSSFYLVLSSFTVSHSILLLLSCVFHFMSHFCPSSSASFDFISLLSSGSSFVPFSFYISLSLSRALALSLSRSLSLSLVIFLSLPSLFPLYFLYALFLTCCPKSHQHPASHYSH